LRVFRERIEVCQS